VIVIYLDRMLGCYQMDKMMVMLLVVVLDYMLDLLLDLQLVHVMDQL